MSKIKIGIIREGKIPVDRRVALTPDQAAEVVKAYPDVEIVAQKSEVRCFEDNAYANAGIAVVDSVADCDILLGVKEVPIPELLSDKTYFFFSHTIKKQAYNRDLLREVLAKNIKLIDYETLTDTEGKRIIAFGRWAGIVGAYNGIWTYGQRYNLFHLKRAVDCFDLNELYQELEKVTLPPIKIVLTGGGRVAKGAIEILMRLGIKKITPAQFMQDEFDFPVFTALNARDYNVRSDGSAFVRSDFYQSPGLFKSNFLPYAQQADLLIASAFWDPRAPVLFEREDILKPDFKINVIADITCDIEGSIPSTKEPSTIASPIYDYNPSDDRIEPPLSDEGNITVMAVDNLPCELPGDASASFGRQLIDNVLPALLHADTNQIIHRATIAQGGQLTEKFNYLQDYVNG